MVNALILGAQPLRLKGEIKKLDELILLRGEKAS